MFTEILQKAKDLLVTKQQAYQQTFNKESLFVQRVLTDLAKFCRANESCFHKDPTVYAMLEGRREVWLRIQKQINLSPQELTQLYIKGEENGK